MAKVSVVARLKVKADKADAFPAAWDALLAFIDDNEPGTEHYVLHRSTTDPTLFFVTEVYENQAALDAHITSDAFAAFGASLGDFIEDADMQFLTPVNAAKGLL
ncbi:MAG: antibiotic biosynthesis monooxygenase [Acidimicrobiia bacterium]|nr:antibiotic biosynthesis monooxygenase [Acidimicrobiia bacterium]MCX6503876.1 antibiotic biosynthesis monooxygenase [Actinomycetota bacterium]